ncbi:ABC transporter ATP-binding protein [Falsiroseomonas oryziterrae]|uniref:ABC transporter ATP-binding protein n=1 Tax=Falsiroseomonas oryziterrae TaxID=2911368 RepID=UPI001F35516F|nr:ABC transporter ATP-binding protein [Roseomonas sp. NPKOSM-4]
MSVAAMEAIGLTRRFGGLVAVNEVNLALHVGELHAVIGPNGAGKSTLTNLLSGELRPSAGKLLLHGAEVGDWPSWRFARAGVGRSFQRTNVLKPMTVRENVRLAAQARLTPLRRYPAVASEEHAPSEAADAALERVGLGGAAHRTAGTLSHGQLRQLEIAMALAAGPTVLLLDEPLAGMGPEESERLALLLKELAADHAVMLIEHDMDVVFAVADRVTVMVDGRVLENGTPEHIRNAASVRDAYLGHAA